MELSQPPFTDAERFIVGTLAGGLLGAAMSIIVRLPGSLENAGPIAVLGLSMTFALFGAIPALLFGLPAVSFLRRRHYPRAVATVILGIGGALVGGLIMFATFGGFEGFGLFQREGAIAGASIGLVFGLLFFRPGSSQT